MPNINRLTNAVGGRGPTSPSTYYTSSPSNYGEYGFIFLTDIVNNFTAAYTGSGKILANVLKGDINFHAHRAVQELSYDTLVSHRSQEIEVCPSLKMPLPHDYVNYVKLTVVDSQGIEHVLYPTKNTSNPFPISQTSDCSYDIEDTFLKQQTGESNTWENFSTGSATQTTIGASDALNPSIDNSHYFQNTGERYGISPENAQSNGTFFIDYELGNIHFSSSLSGKTIILKYISDGHDIGDDSKVMVPKLAEEAMYKWIAYGCAQARTDVDPNTVARLKKERFAETRKAKLRLSIIKLE